MISRDQAIEELDRKICFINAKYASSDIPVSKLLEEYPQDIASTEGEIAILLAYDPLAQFKTDLKSMREKLAAEASSKESPERMRPALDGELRMLDKILDLLGDTAIKDPEEISRNKIAEAEEYLKSNIINEDAAQNILRAIIGIIFGAELYSNRPAYISAVMGPIERK